jgi:hypothetical protein
VAGTRIVLGAEGPPSLARGGGAKRALAALAAGRLTSEGFGSDRLLRGRLDTEVRRQGSAAVCRDGRDVELAPLFLTVARTTSRLSIGGPGYGGGGAPLRTRCPGPEAAEGRELVAGRFPTRELAGDRVTVPMALVPGDSWPFGMSAATTTMTIRRVSARVRLVRRIEG